MAHPNAGTAGGPLKPAIGLSGDFRAGVISACALELEASFDKPDTKAFLRIPIRTAN